MLPKYRMRVKMINLSEIEKIVRSSSMYKNKALLAIDQVNRLTQQVSPILKGAVQSALKMQAMLSHIEKRREREKKALSESGWWLSPTIMQLPAGVMDGAVNRYVEGEQGAISDFFLSLFDHTDFSNLDWMVEQWLTNRFFNKWEKPINEAAQAYKNAQYFLAIPTCLLLTEGIATDFCKSNLLAVKPSRGNDKIVKAIKHVENSGTHFPRSEILFEVLDSIIYVNSQKRMLLNQYFLNRHAVLHGLDHGYGTRENAVKAFLLLDVLRVLE